MSESEQIPVAQATEALTDWTNPPTLSNLKQHLEDARPIHMTQMGKIQTWNEHTRMEGSAKQKFAEGNSQVQPKLIRKQAEWRYPSLTEPFLSNVNIFSVKPVSWEDRERANQNELVLNNQFNTKLDKVAFIDEYVRTAADDGTVVVMVGWESEEEDYVVEEPVIEYHADPSFGPMLEQAAQALQAGEKIPPEIQTAIQYTQQNGVPYRPVQTGTQQVTKTRFIKNQPTVDVCDPANVIMDPTAMGRIDKANFMIRSFESSLSELKKDNRYKNLDKIQVSNNNPLNEPDHASKYGASNFNFSDKPRTKIVVYEFWGMWDIDGSGVVQPIVAAWVGDTLIRMEKNPFPDKKLPFVVKQFLPVRKSNYGEPDAELLIDNQKIIGAVTRGMIDILAKSANGQTGMAKNMLDETNRRKFEKGRDYEFNPGIDPTHGIYMHKFPEIPQSAPLMLQLQNQDAESLTGVKSFTSGVTGNSLGDVAAGVRGALDAASKRETSILRRLAEGIVEIGRKIIAMNAVFLSDQEVIRVTNEEFVTVDREDLPGNYDLQLSISTAEEDDSKAKELAFMLQTMGPQEDPAVRTMILADICRLRKMPDLAHKLENYKPEPNPFQQQMQQLELAMKQAEVEELKAKTAQLYAQAGLAQGKTGTEQVKQAHVQSDTDKRNLDFVEQESGVQQERELQKIDRKAEHDKHKEVVKAAVAPQKESQEK